MTTQIVETTKASVPPVVATDRSAGKARLLYLDNLRMMVITVVVVMHSAIMYGAEGAWYYHEAGEKDTLIFVIMMLLGGIGTAFVMGLLFLVAGYFTPRSYDRKGAGPFLVIGSSGWAFAVILRSGDRCRSSVICLTCMRVSRVAGAVAG